jgi:anti-sigma regulatory factor (Ser/Thr protein kinase)
MMQDPAVPTHKGKCDEDKPLVLELAWGPGAVREGRRHLEEALAASGAIALLDDAALVVAELLANAVQHGSPPLSIAVRAEPSKVRIEVHDANARPPVRPVASSTTMTGRGLALVAAVSARWGVDRSEPDGGKVVWAELEPTPDGSPREEVVVDEPDRLESKR